MKFFQFTVYSMTVESFHNYVATSITVTMFMKLRFKTCQCIIIQMMCTYINDINV